MKGQRKKTYIINVDDDTFEKKEELKKLGCKWDAENKKWRTTDPYIASTARRLIDKRIKRNIDKELNFFRQVEKWLK